MNLWEEFVGYFRQGLESIAGFYGFLGDHKWAAGIVTLTLIVRTLVLPLAVKQIRSMRETQRLQPELQRLRQKYRTDRQKLTQETMELFRREGVNPYASCLPMVAQMPVFIAMFYTIRDLARVRGLEMPFLGLADLTVAANKSVGGWLLIVVMTLTQLLTTRQLNPGQTDQQKRLQMMLPFLFIFLFMSFPAALVLYWATQNLYALVQQMIMTRNVPGAGLRLGSLWPFGRRRDQGKRSKVKAQAPVQAQAAAAPSLPLAGGSGLPDAEARRVLAEKRRRRRRKKKKRR